MNGEHAAIAAAVDRTLSNIGPRFGLHPDEMRQEAWAAALAVGHDGDIDGAVWTAIRALSHDRWLRRRLHPLSIDYGWDMRRVGDGLGESSMFEHVYGSRRESTPSAEDDFLQHLDGHDDDADDDDLASRLALLHPTIAAMLVEVVESGRNAYTVGRERGMSTRSVERVLRAAGLTETGKIRNRRQGRRCGWATVDGLVGLTP